jgi:hypothetical protein
MTGRSCSWRNGWTAWTRNEHSAICSRIGERIALSILGFHKSFSNRDALMLRLRRTRIGG